MGDLTSFITIAPSNTFYFTNACNNDMLIYTESSTQNIHIGTQCNINSILKISSNELTVGGSIIPATTLTYDLGSSNNRFRDLYLSGQTIDLGGTKLQTNNTTGDISIVNQSGNYGNIIANKIQIGTAANSVIIGLDSSNQISFINPSTSNVSTISGGNWSNTGLNSLFIIDSNVGIGTSNPLYPLDIVGDLNFTGTLRKNGTAYIGSQWTNTSSNLYIYSYNVGINTSNPTAALEVDGSAIIRSNLSVSNVANFQSNVSIAGDLNFNGILKQNGAAYVGSQWTNTSSNLYILSSNVGINTSNPTAALEVAGSAIIRSNLSIAGDLNFNGILKQNGAAYVGSQWTNTSSNLYILSSNVGLGTSSPAYTLDVAGDLQVRSNLILGNNAANFRGIKIQKNPNGTSPYNAITNLVVDIPGCSNSSNLTTVFSDFQISSNLILTNTMRMRGLYIQANSNVSGTPYNITSQTTSIPGYSNSNNITTLYASKYVNIIASNVEVIRFNSNGYVGIGTTTPTYPLDVNGAARFIGNVTASSFIGNSTSASLLATQLITSSTITGGPIITFTIPGPTGGSIYAIKIVPGYYTIAPQGAIIVAGVSSSLSIPNISSYTSSVSYNGSTFSLVTKDLPNGSYSINIYYTIII